LQKHIARYKLDRRKINVIYRDGDPTKPVKKRKNDLGQKPGKTGSASGNRNTRSTKNLDSIGDFSGNRKSKSSATKPKVEKPKATKQKPKTTKKPKINESKKQNSNGIDAG